MDLPSSQQVIFHCQRSTAAETLVRLYFYYIAEAVAADSQLLLHQSIAVSDELPVSILILYLPTRRSWVMRVKNWNVKK
jgi:hypothetical protein